MRPSIGKVGLAVFLLACASCAGDSPEPDLAALVAALNLDPSIDLNVDCPVAPSNSRLVLFTGVFMNDPPVRPDNPDFPADYCPANTQFFARAAGQGHSNVLGEYTWSEKYCALPGFQLTADGSFDGGDGNRLIWQAHVRADSVPPPIPNATFVGQFTFIGGSGLFEGASGQGNVVAKQLGDAPAGLPAGSTAAAICGWVDN